MNNYVFKPSLQDISMKRFRVRYCPFYDHYYLQWSDTVVPQLAKIRGLENGVHSVFRVGRAVNEQTGVACLTHEQEDDDELSHDYFSFPPSISWKLDFSDCGLAIMSAKIKAKTLGHGVDNTVSFEVMGENGSLVDNSIRLGGDKYTEVPFLRGSKSLTLTAHLHTPPGSSHSRPIFLPSDSASNSPLDIIVHLLCPKPACKEFNSAGEILLGLKYSLSGASESLRERGDITVNCGVMGGQLQVHVVEGAGLKAEGTKKALNSFVKCKLLPDAQKTKCHQTSAKHSAYPTWAKEFIFAGIDQYDIENGGLEITLHNRQTFTSALVGGVRFSIPQKVYEASQHQRMSIGALPMLHHSSPTNSRSSSPYHDSPSPVSGGTSLGLVGGLDKRTSCSMADLLVIDTASTGSPSLGHTLSKTAIPRSLTPSPSPTASPLMRRVPVFTLPQRWDSGSNSPVMSPRIQLRGRKSPNSKSSPKRRVSYHPPHDNNLLYWWMDSSGDEINHWQQVLDNPGEWVYCWHVLRSTFEPAR